MNLDEAKRVIDRAWNAPPVAIDWNEVEEAASVIAAETGSTYVPHYAKDKVADRVRAERRLEPARRGNGHAYDAAARRMDDGAINPPSASVYRSIRDSIPEEPERELPEAPPPGWR